jgi:hypothetical protein
MPASSFLIKYKASDFYYNTTDQSENSDLLASFPFTQQSVIKWANEVSKIEPPILAISDIFDPQINNIILNPDYDFKNTFLPGNIIFNDDFNRLTLNLTGEDGSIGSRGSSSGSSFGRGSSSDSSSGGFNISNNLSDQTASISGNIELKPSSPDQKPTTLAINMGKDSNINWKQDETNSWKPTFDINAAISKEFPFTDIDGGESTIIMTTENPRCKFRKTCTINHWHYSGACKTQIITGANGGTSCKCICTGVPVFNNAPHSHCDAYTINPDGTVLSATGDTTAPTGIGLVAAIQGMKMNLTANFPQSPFFEDNNENSSFSSYFRGSNKRSNTIGGQGGVGGSDVSMPFGNSSKLDQNAATIRNLIYDYYYQVNENIKLQTTIQDKGNKDITSQQILSDANTEYRKGYLNVFNIIVGIFGTGGYIYLMSKT